MKMKDIKLGKTYKIKARTGGIIEQDIVFTEIDRVTNKVRGYVVGQKRIDGDPLYTYEQLQYMIHHKFIAEIDKKVAA